MQSLLLQQYYSNLFSLKKGVDRVVQLLTQVTATLRNLSLPNAHKSLFLSTNCIVNLCNLMGSSNYCNRADLMLNVTRILSKLTLYDECTLLLTSHKTCLQSMINLMTNFKDQAVSIVIIDLSNN
jgi:hypothetical protein